MDRLFDPYIKHYLDAYKPKKILEIGVLKGANTIQILRWCKENDAILMSIDPVKWNADIPDDIKAPYEGYQFKRGSDKHTPEMEAPFLSEAYKEGLFEYWQPVKDLSINYLQTSDDVFDAAIIDGDHNYYTVINELQLVAERLSDTGFIALNDVYHKWARKDLYYDIDNIPQEWRYGPKQGVLLAIEDFLAGVSGKKTGALAGMEVAFREINKRSYSDFFARMKGALRILRRGYDYYLAEQVYTEYLGGEYREEFLDKYLENDKKITYTFTIPSTEQYGLGVIEKKTIG